MGVMHRGSQARIGRVSKIMTTVFINLVLFKIAWAATVITAAASMPILGVVAVTGAAALRLAWAGDARAEGLLLLTAAAIGFGWESLLVTAGVLQYEAGMLAPGLAPYWIVAMWVLFATTLNVGMRWLRKSVFVAAIAGAIGGPLSFLAGSGAGAVELMWPIASLLVIGAGWAVLLPMLVWFAERFDGEARRV